MPGNRIVQLRGGLMTALQQHTEFAGMVINTFKNDFSNPYSNWLATDRRHRTY
jgi:hypothetical protein